MSGVPPTLARIRAVARRFANGELPARDVMRIALRVSRLDRLKRVSDMVASTASLRAENDAMRQALLTATEVRRQLDAANVAIAHLRRVEAEYARVVAANEQAAARLLRYEATGAQAETGVRAFVDRMQDILFEHAASTSQSSSAATLVLGNQPVDDALATLVNLSEPAHGARPFQYLLPFLARNVPFPLPWPEGAAPLRVVDAGSQALSFESDMHAPLHHVAPVDVTGFDPFTAASDQPDGVTVVPRPDNRTIRTYPCLLADGGTVTFHVNRFDPTSSILPANHALTRPFGLLDLSLETVETRQMPSRRLDDVLDDAIPVDLLKVDVQGASHTVLNHAGALLRRTLVCHVEAEFAPVYLGERLFADIDILLRGAGFAFVDFFSLGRQRYASFDTSRDRAFHRGRTLWADCVYVRDLDTPGGLTADELFRAALIMHVCYNKQDLAAELLGRADALTGGASLPAYISGLTPEDAK